jgi:hypothetical protein
MMRIFLNKKHAKRFVATVFLAIFLIPACENVRAISSDHINNNTYHYSDSSDSTNEAETHPSMDAGNKDIPSVDLFVCEGHTPHSPCGNSEPHHQEIALRGGESPQPTLKQIVLYNAFVLLKSTQSISTSLDIRPGNVPYSDKQ